MKYLEQNMEDRDEELEELFEEYIKNLKKELDRPLGFCEMLGLKAKFCKEFLEDLNSKYIQNK
ncbi:MAG TPA: hypothetical protein VHA52_10120 [Candidatus Babeliaceae bacterium]|nr:hypothetical protein [Candidatus Babeliaceae bacterium]